MPRMYYIPRTFSFYKNVFLFKEKFMKNYGKVVCYTNLAHLKLMCIGHTCCFHVAVNVFTT